MPDTRLLLLAIEAVADAMRLCEAVAALCLADARVVSVRVRSMKTGIYPDARVGCEIERTR
jgi:dihydroneopterin aldolase